MLEHVVLAVLDLRRGRDGAEIQGGRLLRDHDFHGSREWRVFIESMQRVFPDRPIVELPDDDQIFHTFWDLDHREQILNELREDEAFVRMMRAQTGPGPLEQRLGTLRGDDAVPS